MLMSDGGRCNGDKPGRQGGLRVRRGHAVKTGRSGMVSMRTGSLSGTEGAVGRIWRKREQGGEACTQSPGR